MDPDMIWQTSSTGSADTERLGELLGKQLRGGEAVELRSDLGGGKTTFVRGLARGFDSKDTVSSPTFTLNKIYRGRGGMEIHHFDFYRLNEPGVVADQLAESLENPKVITVVEWSDIVKDVLPSERLSVEFKPVENDSEGREVTITYPISYANLIKQLETDWVETRP